MGLPWWLRGQSICLQCGRPVFDPWVGNILWRGKWQPTPVFLPGESIGQRSLVGYSSLCTHTHTYPHIHNLFLTFVNNLCGLDCKESACNPGYPGSIPESERSSGEGHGYPLPYSFHGQRILVVHGITKS